MQAHYLVLFGGIERPRAILFDAEHHALAEMIDADAFSLDTLVRASTVCALQASMLEDLERIDQRLNPLTARCFRIDGQAARLARA